MFGAEALTESAVGQEASIERANRIPAKSVPEGYATHTHKHTHTLSLFFVCVCVCVCVCVDAHTHTICVCLSLLPPRAHTHKSHIKECTPRVLPPANLRHFDGILDSTPLTILILARATGISSFAAFIFLFPLSSASDPTEN